MKGSQRDKCAWRAHVLEKPALENFTAGYRFTARCRSKTQTQVH